MFANGKLSTKDALGIFVLGVIINTMGLLYTQHHGLRHFHEKQCTNPRDLGFLSMGTDMSLKSALNSPLFVALPVVSTLLSSQRLEILRDFAVLFGVVLMFRGVSISLTQLPHTTEVEQRSLLQQCLFGGDYDKIFSGHTAFMVIITMLLVQYGVWSPVMYLLPVVVGLVLVRTRSHYSVDVFLGGLISVLLVLVYRRT